MATILLNHVAITNEGDGVFLRAAAAGWGNTGSNGGQVTLTAEDQVINGDMLVDEVSNLNLYLTEGSTFTGNINPDGAEGDVYVEVTDGAKWVLTADSYITSLTCDADSIDLNGHTLYVSGAAYTAGTASSGTAIEVTVSASNGHGGMGGPPSDGMGGPPSGGMGEPPAGGKPPEKP